MKANKTILALMLLSKAAASPAFANYFHNGRMNVMSNPGSAPNPRVRDIRSKHEPMTVQDQTQGPSTAVTEAPEAPGNSGSGETYARNDDPKSVVPQLRLSFWS
mgnify:CR=1 FL=1